MEEYSEYLKKKDESWENLCIRCGGCCGAFDDPCLHLRKDSAGKCFCNIYSSRFGIRESIKGEKFNCVPIKEILTIHWKNDYLCVYKKHCKNIWYNGSVT